MTIIEEAEVDYKEDEFPCFGGPYDGCEIKLHSPGTLEFKVRNFKGCYNRNMKWIDTNG